MLGVILLFAALTGCELVPSKPEAVFILYRDRMKAEKIDEARQLLSEDSRKMAVRLASVYRLKQPPENLALLNILDPVSAPLLMKTEETHALLQLRALKGGMKVISLVRQSSDSPWKIEITRELKALQNFLGAQRALDSMREQASEYAASWKAFSTQLERMKVSPSGLEKEQTEEKLRNAERAKEPHRRRRAPQTSKKRGKEEK